MFANCKIVSFTNSVVYDHIHFHRLKRFLFRYKRPFYGTKANSADPDQTPHDAVSDQDLHYLLTECSIKFFETNTKTKKTPNTF